MGVSAPNRSERDPSRDTIPSLPPPAPVPGYHRARPRALQLPPCPAPLRTGSVALPARGTPGAVVPDLVDTSRPTGSSGRAFPVLASRAAFKPANQKAALARTGQWQSAAAGNLNAAWGGRGQWQRAAAAERSVAAAPDEVWRLGPGWWGRGPCAALLERAVLCLQSCRGLSREPAASPLSALGLTGLVYPSAGYRSGGAVAEAKPVLILGVAEVQGFSSLAV